MYLIKALIKETIYSVACHGNFEIYLVRPSIVYRIIRFHARCGASSTSSNGMNYQCYFYPAPPSKSRSNESFTDENVFSFLFGGGRKRSDFNTDFLRTTSQAKTLRPLRLSAWDQRFRESSSYYPVSRGGWRLSKSMVWDRHRHQLSKIPFE